MHEMQSLVHHGMQAEVLLRPKLQALGQTPATAAWRLKCKLTCQVILTSRLNDCGAGVAGNGSQALRQHDQHEPEHVPLHRGEDLPRGGPKDLVPHRL